MKLVTIKFLISGDFKLSKPTKTVKESKENRGKSVKQLSKEIKANKAAIKENNAHIERLQAEIDYLQGISKGKGPRQIKSGHSVAKDIAPNIPTNTAMTVFDPNKQLENHTAENSEALMISGDVNTKKGTATAPVNTNLSLASHELHQAKSSTWMTTGPMAWLQRAVATFVSCVKHSFALTNRAQSSTLVENTALVKVSPKDRRMVNYVPTQVPTLQGDTSIDATAIMALGPPQNTQRDILRADLQKGLTLLQTGYGLEYADAKVIHTVVRPMEKYPSDPEIQFLGCSVLSLLAQFSDGGEEAIQGTISALKNHGGDPKVQLAAYENLQEWSKHPSLDACMVELGVISIIEAAAEATAQAQEALLNIVANLMVNPDCPEIETAVEVGINAALSTLSEKRNDGAPQLHSLGVQILSDWSRGDGDIASLIPKGVVTALLNASRVLAAAEWTQTQVWMLLVKLANNEALAVEEIRDGVKRANTALKEEPTDSFCIQLILRFLYQIGPELEEGCLERQTYDEVIAECGTIDSIVSGMKRHPEDHHLQIEACRLLKYDINRDCQPFLDANGMEVLVGSLTSHAGKSSELALTGLEVLKMLIDGTTDESTKNLPLAASVGLAPCLVTLVDFLTSTKDATEEEALEVACGLINRLCESGYQAAILSEQGVTSIICAMESLSSVHSNALKALSNLQRYSAQTVSKIIVEDDGLPVLVSAMDSVSDVPWLGCDLLNDILSHSPPSFSVLLDAGILEKTLEIMTNHPHNKTVQVRCGMLLNHMMCPKRSPIFIEARQHCKDHNGVNIVADALTINFPFWEEGNKEVDRIVGAAFGYVLNPPIASGLCGCALSSSKVC